MHNLFNDEALKNARQYSPTTHVLSLTANVFIGVTLNMALTLTKVHGVHHKSLITLSRNNKALHPVHSLGLFCWVNGSLSATVLDLACHLMEVSPAILPLQIAQETQSSEICPPFPTTHETPYETSRIRKLSLMHLYQKMKSRPSFAVKIPWTASCLLGKQCLVRAGAKCSPKLFLSPVAGGGFHFLHAVFKHIMDLLSSLEDLG